MPESEADQGLLRLEKGFSNPELVKSEADLVLFALEKPLSGVDLVFSNPEKPFSTLKLVIGKKEKGFAVQKNYKRRQKTLVGDEIN